MPDRRGGAPRSVLSKYERALLEKIDNIRKGETEKVKGSLARELRKLDRDTSSQRLNRAEILLTEIKRALTLMGFSYAAIRAKLSSDALPGSSQGLGSLAFDVGISWEPALDVPVIPGSGIKGAMRSLANELLGNSGNYERVLEPLFGRPGDAGHVGLVSPLDALPVRAEDGLIGEDVINPHYNAQVRRIEVELDVVPVPVLHMVIRRGVTFEFILTCHPRVREIPQSQLSELRELAEALRVQLPNGPPHTQVLKLSTFLLGGVLKRGVGARTLKGYGKFDPESIKVVEVVF